MVRVLVAMRVARNKRRDRRFLGWAGASLLVWLVACADEGGRSDLDGSTSEAGEAGETESTGEVGSSSGGESSASSGMEPQTDGESGYTIGGAVSGLEGAVTLRLEAGEELVLEDDGAFTFATELGDGDGYAVSVEAQPQAGFCVLENASGSIGGVDVTDIIVTCGASGSLDPTFGDDGFVSHGGGAASRDIAFADSIEIEPEGRYLLAGARFELVDNGYRSYDAAVWRVTPDGALDTSFGAVGEVVVAGEFFHFARAVLDPDHRIVAAGHLENNSGARPLLARYLDDGQPDGAFGSGGITDSIPGGADWGVFLDVVVDGQRRVVAAGESGGSFVVARYDSSGNPDPTFGSDGVFVLGDGPEGAGDRATGLSLDSGGRIVVVGSVWGYSDDDLVVVRLTEDGALDPSFADAGVHQYGRGSYVSEQATAVAFDASDRIIVAGRVSAGDVQLAVHRLAADGSPDASFGDAGVALIVPPGGADIWPRDLAIDAQGRPVVVGAEDSGAKIWRLTADGALDGDFAGGAAALGLADAGRPRFEAVAFDELGRLVVAGSFFYGDTVADLALWRVLP